MLLRTITAMQRANEFKLLKELLLNHVEGNTVSVPLNILLNSEVWKTQHKLYLYCSYNNSNRTVINTIFDIYLLLLVSPDTVLVAVQ